MLCVKRIWHHRSDFAANVLLEFSTGKVSRIVCYEIVTSKFICIAEMMNSNWHLLTISQSICNDTIVWLLLEYSLMLFVAICLWPIPEEEEEISTKRSKARFILHANAKRIWRHNPPFTAIFASELSGVELLRIFRCKFVTSTYVSHSHSQELWTGLKTLVRIAETNSLLE